MMSIALATLLFAGLVASAPAPLVARAPASVRFNAPPSIVATCSAPVTLSWSIRSATGDDADDVSSSDIRVSRVMVASSTNAFTQTLVEDPERRTFVWEQVNVAPGEYVITGAVVGADGVDVRASDTFTVRAGESVDCVQAAASLSSSAAEQSSTAPTESATASVAVSPSSSAQPTSSPAAQSISSATTGSGAAPTGSSNAVNGGLIAALIVVIVLIFAVGAGIFYWRRLNRARQLVDVEYVYPPGVKPEPKISSDDSGRRSNDTVIEVYARAPTPLGMLSRTTTKQQMLASDIDLTKTQKMLRQL